MNKSGFVALAVCLVFAAAVAAKPAEDKPESGIVGSDPVTNAVQGPVERFCWVGTHKKGKSRVVAFFRKLLDML